MFPERSLGLIQGMLYIWVVVVQILIYVLLLFLCLGSFICWFHLGPRHRVLLGFCESIGLAEVSIVVG